MPMLIVVSFPCRLFGEITLSVIAQLAFGVRFDDGSAEKEAFIDAAVNLFTDVFENQSPKMLLPSKLKKFNTKRLT